jgi:rare lipoprotein A
VRARGLALAVLAAGATTAGAVAAPDSGTASAASPGVTMATSHMLQKVRYGKAFHITGRSSAGAGKAVRLEQAARGAAFQHVADVRTRSDGSYSFTVKATRSGSYRTVGETGAPTPPRRVTVVASVKARSTRHVLSGHTSRVRGRLAPGTAGRKVTVQVRSKRGWRTVAHTRTRSGGAFRARFTPRGPGRYRVRVKAAGDRTAGAGAARSWRVNAYRSSAASWYGPGLYGNKLGCGGTLSPGTVGAANKHLPCGTKVTFRYHGRSVTAPVVDRGPYVGGREWDLTPGLKAKLHFGSTGTVLTTR